MNLLYKSQVQLDRTQEECGHTLAEAWEVQELEVAAAKAWEEVLVAKAWEEVLGTMSTHLAQVSTYHRSTDSFAA